MPSLSNLKYIVISAILLVLGFTFIKNTFEVYKRNIRLEKLEAEVTGLEVEKEDLMGAIEYQHSDEYIEEEARNKLNLIKPGEKVFVVTPELEQELIKDAMSKKLTYGVEDFEDKSNFERWFELVF